MTIRFVEAARAELRRAFDWYEQQRAGLGSDFAIAVAQAVDDIIDAPHAWSLVQGEIRKRKTGRFPYGVFYAVEREVVTILGVFHLHSDPGAWRELLEQRS